ncbi:MAG: hypothetical protein SGJ02_06965 [bacterium]|nr:hypothetical protein [bacterium]
MIKVISKAFVFTTLSLLVTSSSAFAAAEAEKEILKAQAANPDVINCYKELKEAALNLGSENAITDTATLKADVEGYYRGQFGEEYKKKNNGTAFAALDSHVNAIDSAQMAAQYYYIAKNSNPLGSKQKMDKSDDKSKYSEIHAKCHPKTRATLDENGLYDIFFFDDATGRVFYTVYKELDFFGIVKSGPNAGSGLGQVYQKAQAAKQGEVVESSVDKYGFSYDVLALFISTPVYDGATRIGTMAYQVNP